MLPNAVLGHRHHLRGSDRSNTWLYPATPWADPVSLVPRTQNKKIIIFYGSQTGSAEDYGTRIAKEAKARFGLSSLVCDPEE